MTFDRRAILLFVVLAIAAVVPLRNYDLFWHLATGRWIIEHRALPANDPFAVASDRGPWINDEWLFEVVLHPLQQAIGFNGLTVLRALFFAALFAFVAKDWFVGAIAFAGANSLLDVRPASIAAAFVTAAIAIARRSWIGFAVLTAVWINVHPSALIAPLIMLVMTRSPRGTLASVVALFVSPYGWRAIVAPIATNALVTSGAFMNAEWQRSSPLIFPILYLTIIAGVVILRKDWSKLAIFAMFAILAILHVRHQPLYYGALIVLLPPVASRISMRIIGVAAVVLAIIIGPRGIGLQQHRWPVDAVARLQASGLRGNIYNPDQFGGYLEWAFYPQRRALTDGRNELFRAYNAEYAIARNDGRAWAALLRKYRIDLAVDEYRGEKVTVVNAMTHAQVQMPASLVYWPRSQWALIAYDDAGMVFARRAAFPPEVLQRWELRGVVPDAN